MAHLFVHHVLQDRITIFTGLLHASPVRQEHIGLDQVLLRAWRAKQDTTRKSQVPPPARPVLLEPILA